MAPSHCLLDRHDQAHFVDLGVAVDLAGSTDLFAESLELLDAHPLEAGGGGGSGGLGLSLGLRGRSGSRGVGVNQRAEVVALDVVATSSDGLDAAGTFGSFDPAVQVALEAHAQVAGVSDLTNDVVRAGDDEVILAVVLSLEVLVHLLGVEGELVIPLSGGVVYPLDVRGDAGEADFEVLLDHLAGGVPLTPGIGLLFAELVLLEVVHGVGLHVLMVLSESSGVFGEEVGVELSDVGLPSGEELGDGRNVAAGFHLSELSELGLIGGKSFLSCGELLEGDALIILGIAVGVHGPVGLGGFGDAIKLGSETFNLTLLALDPLGNEFSCGHCCGSFRGSGVGLVYLTR